VDCSSKSNYYWQLAHELSLNKYVSKDLPILPSLMYNGIERNKRNSLFIVARYFSQTIIQILLKVSTLIIMLLPA